MPENMLSDSSESHNGLCIGLKLAYFPIHFLYFVGHDLAQEMDMSDL